MKKRKIGKGKPLTEMVKGSLDYTMRRIRDDFRAQFMRGYEDEWRPYIVEIFADYVVVEDTGLAVDEYYRVTYQQQDGKYVFAPRDEWEVVELTYQPQTMAEGKTPSPALPLQEGGKPKGQRFEERVDQRLELLESEGEESGPRRVRAVGITADVINENGRRYPRAVLRQAIAELQGHLHESAGQGRLIQVLGEAEHPSDKPTRRPNLLETVVVWEQVTMPGDQVILEGKLLETSKGKDVKALIAGGVQIGVSQRAYGNSRVVREGGRHVEEVTELHITGYDLTLEPSDPNGGIEAILERTAPPEGQGPPAGAQTKEKETMDPQEILEQLQSSGVFDDLTERVRTEILEAMRADDEERKMRALREALGVGPDDDLLEAVQRLRAEQQQERPDAGLEQNLRQVLGLGEEDDLQEALQQRESRRRELEEKDRQQQVAAYIQEQTQDLAYPDWLRAQMVESVQSAQPGTMEEAEAILASRRKEYDAIMAKLELGRMGHDGGVQVLGPVLERETGVPEYARGAHLLTESMVRAGQARPRRWNQDPVEMSLNERFARLYLERFDRDFRQHLMREAKLIEEAETTTDLNLPYSVARAIIAEAVPQLVAVSIFDVGITDQAPSRIYFEKYEDETGVENTITDESVTLTALGTWYDLAHQRVRPGTVVVTDNTGATTYVEGTDYVINYADGKIQGLSGGSITPAQEVLVDYTYDAIREGEMAAIQRGKQTLSFKTLEIAADRLADQISSEVIEFARSQLGYDATGRTLGSLVRRIREVIDKHLLWMGLSAALSLANNSGGTWSATPGGTDTYDQNLDILFRYIGVAKVKVANRFYQPNFTLGSLTTTDLMSNSKQFTQAGQRPDADLNAAGYVGRAKGLPVFASTQFPDNYILVGNQELVMHRVFRALQLKGPYPSYDTAGKLIAADQYYAEEYNGSDAPVPEKGAYLVLTS